MSASESCELTRGPVPGHLLRLALPMCWGYISLSAFNLIDTYFVAKLGIKELAALSFIFPVMAFVFAFANALGVGASSNIARAVGNGDKHQVKRFCTDSIVLTFLIVCVLSLIGICTIEPLFHALGATDDLMPDIKKYMITWYAGGMFIFLPMVSNHTMRALGDTFTSSLVMTGMVIANLILDPILIFGWGPIPACGLTGAALAAIISRIVALIGTLALLHYKYDVLDYHLPSRAELRHSCSRIMRISIPTTGVNLLQPLSAAFVTFLAAKYGHQAVAATGAANRIFFFAYAIPQALSVAMLPLGGQNWGRDLKHRTFEAWLAAMKFSWIYGFATFLFFLCCSRYIAGWFSTESDVIHLISLNVIIITLFSAFEHIAQNTNMLFNAIGKPFFAVFITAVKGLVLLIPLTWLGSSIGGIQGLFWGWGISIMLGGLIAWHIIYREFPPNLRKAITEE